MNTSSPIFWILYIVLLGGMLYFMAIRPQKKEKQRQQQLLNSVAVGDTILTSSGFYGVIIDMTDGFSDIYHIFSYQCLTGGESDD